MDWAHFIFCLPRENSVYYLYHYYICFCMPHEDAYKKVFIGGSPIQGRGLFARKRICRDEKLFPLNGPIIHYTFLPHALIGPNWINVAKNKWVIPNDETPWRYLNHSCEANVAWGRGRELVAMREIQPNEEFKLDYSLAESAPNWRMKCRCGTASCRQIIRGVQFLPRAIFQKYRKYIPAFLQKEYYKNKVYFPEASSGAGIFAKQFLKRGTRVFIVEGPVVHYPSQPDGRVGPLWLCVGERSWLVPLRENPWRFMNHSCQPNTGLMRKNIVVALKDIRADEEITIDDSITETAPQWRRTCHCGTPQCRREIRSVQFLPRELYLRYLPYVPTFMQKVYNEKIRFS